VEQKESLLEVEELARVKSVSGSFDQALSLDTEELSVSSSSSTFAGEPDLEEKPSTLPRKEIFRRSLFDCLEASNC
jgi:hypothetical protein